MRFRVSAALFALGLAFSSSLHAQQMQPPGVGDALMNLASQPATHTAVVFDRDMIQGLLSGQPLAALSSITFDSYRYREPAFYTPEAMTSLNMAYDAAGWHHLVNANASPRDSAAPPKPITDMWLHFQGMNVDGCTVVIRGPRQMNVIEVTGLFRPLDLVHLSGHLGIPQIDPGAVMVPAPPPPPPGR